MNMCFELFICAKTGLHRKKVFVEEEKISYTQTFPNGTPPLGKICQIMENVTRF